jgi:hypothetical protein
MPHTTGTCVSCKKERKLLYARRTMCATYACQRAAAAEVAARKAANGVSESSKKAPPVFCYKIVSVHGVRDFDAGKLVGKEKRNQVHEEEFMLSYLVLGTFAEDEVEVGFPDTRWVALEDLLQNLDDEELKPLQEYEKKLAKRMAGERKRLRQAMEEGDEE